MHLNDGQLHAHLDQELNESGERHLAACPACQARLARLSADAGRVGERLMSLGPRPDDPALDPRRALNRFRARPPRPTKETTMLSSLFGKRLRPAWGLLGILAILLVSLSFAPVRAWASEFLGLFRVQQIAVLPVDPTRLSELAGDSTLGRQLGQLISDSVVIQKEPGEPQVVASTDEASQLAGFRVRLLGARTEAPKLTVQDGTAFELTVNRDRAQALLDEAGYDHLQLPASLDGATVSVEIPAGVTAAYGRCPALNEDQIESADPDALPAGASTDCVLLAQIPSPTVNTPPDLDLAQLAEIGLQITGMTPEEARAFSQAVDWTSTLVVPIPRNGHRYRQVQVDGVIGNLIYRAYDDGVPARYTLLWVKDGIVYALAGFGDGGEAVRLGNSIK